MALARRKFLLAMSPELFGRVEAYAKDHEQSVTDVLRMATVQFLAAAPPVTVTPASQDGTNG
jgi:hypothetical protein